MAIGQPVQNVHIGGYSTPIPPYSAQSGSPVAGSALIMDPASGAINGSYALSQKVIDCRDYFKASDNAIGSAWVQLLTDAPAGSSIYIPPHPTKKYLFDVGPSSTLVRKRLRIFSDTFGAKIVFVPTIPGSTWLTASAVGTVAGNPEVTDELQLDGFVLENLRITSDRSVFANAIECDKVDNLRMDNVFIWGFKGFGLKFQNTREAFVTGLRTRFNGWVDPANAANNIADVVMMTNPAWGDTTNFCKFTDSFLIFAFGPSLYMNNTAQMNFGELMIHAIPRANTALEANLLRYFPAWQKGWNSSGVALNDYAALHVSPGGAKADVSGQAWDAHFRDVPNVRLINSDVRISNGQLYGSQSAGCIHADNTSRVGLSNFEMTGAISTQYAPTVDFSLVSANTLTVASKAPHTGTPVVFDLLSGAYAGGIGSRRSATYYAIRIDDTHIKLASSYDNAVAGTAKTDVTSATGTATMTALNGYIVSATGASEIYMDNTSRCTDGYQAGFADATSRLLGDPYTGAQANAWGGGPSMPSIKGEQMLFVLRNANIGSTTNQPFTKVYSGRRYKVTRVVAVNKNGINGSGAVGGIYCGLNATPRTDALVAAATTWTNMSALENAQELTLGAGANKTSVFGSDSASTVVLGLDTAGGAGCLVDIFIYGCVTD